MTHYSRKCSLNYLDNSGELVGQIGPQVEAIDCSRWDFVFDCADVTSVRFHFDSSTEINEN